MIRTIEISPGSTVQHNEEKIMQLILSQIENEMGEAREGTTLSYQIVEQAYREVQAYYHLVTKIYLACGGEHQKTPDMTNDAADEWFQKAFLLTRGEMLSFEEGFNRFFCEEKDFSYETDETDLDKFFLFGYRCGACLDRAKIANVDRK